MSEGERNAGFQKRETVLPDCTLRHSYIRRWSHCGCGCEIEGVIYLMAKVLLLFHLIACQIILIILFKQVMVNCFKDFKSLVAQGIETSF